MVSIQAKTRRVDSKKKKKKDEELTGGKLAQSRDAKRGSKRRGDLDTYFDGGTVKLQIFWLAVVNDGLGRSGAS